MNWIKENRFLVILGSITLVVTALLWILGSSAASRYDDAKGRFDAALSSALNFERLALYPTLSNQAEKEKKLNEYKQELKELQVAFESYRPKAITNGSPQEFVNVLKEANTETRAAFTAKGAELPENYFCGFESYAGGRQPSGNATGVLSYQLGAMRQILLDLAAAGPSKLLNIHRPKLPEEEGKPYEPQKGEIARSLRVEISFQAKEKAARAFVSSLVNYHHSHYVVIRGMRVKNQSKLPPKASDAKFEGMIMGAGTTPAASLFNADSLFGPAPSELAAPTAPAPAPVLAPVTPAPAVTPAPVTPPAPAAPAPGVPVVPEDPAAGTPAIPAVPPAVTPVAPAAPAAPVPAAPGVPDSSQVLAQVLGDEEVQIILILDVMLFNEPGKIP